MKENYSISLIPCKTAKEFIRSNHYSRGCHNGPSPNYGLFENKSLIGCLMIATPCSENVRSSVFGKVNKSKVRELHRLFIIDDTPKNTESWFISRCLKMIREDRPDLWGLISFADTTEGHSGAIYRASNAIYCGMTSPANFYIDVDGRLRHPRQNGVNITLKNAESKGWRRVRRSAKHRFIFILGNKSQKRERMKLLLLGASE